MRCAMTIGLPQSESRDRTTMLDYRGEDDERSDEMRTRPEDHVKLRAVGFDDRGHLKITLISLWFNYINRAADGTRACGANEMGEMLKDESYLSLEEPWTPCKNRSVPDRRYRRSYADSRE